MVKIKKQLVSQSVVSKRSYGYGNPVRYITIHQTGNTNRGANAQAHANIQTNLNPRQASWHYSVDDKQAIQSFDDKVQCWHAFDGRGPGNTSSIAIEICINSDGNYKKAIQNAAELTKHLMDKHNLSIDKVKQHYDWYPKNCPAQLRANYKEISWSDFKKMVTGSKAGVKEAPKPQPKPSNKGEYKGNSIVEYLQSIGVNSSFSNRAKLAKEYGISNYKGTASQNLKLLDKMRGGKPVSKPAPSPKRKGDMKTNSIVDYLKSIGENPSFSNRSKLAAKYGIKNYKGTAAQNIQLLKKMRG